MPAPMKLIDVRNSALKSGVSCNRFKISRQDAKRIRQAEQNDDGLRVLLEILFKPKSLR